MLHLISASRPARVIEPAEAVIEADTDTTIGALQVFGLAALSEHPALVNYGVREHPGAPVTDRLPAGRYTVFAERD